MFYLRDAFLLSLNDNGKFLLHLIELSACDWQLSSAAISYYFPQKPTNDLQGRVNNQLPSVTVN